MAVAQVWRTEASRERSRHSWTYVLAKLWRSHAEHDAVNQAEHCNVTCGRQRDEGEFSQSI